MKPDLEISAFGTATIGSVIEALQFAEPDADVMFDFCGMSPTNLASSRNYYEHLALGWKIADGWPSVSSILADLEDSIDREYEGYKGGRYKMTTDTPVWVDNWGDSSGTAITGIEFLGRSAVVIKTDKID